MRLSPSTVAERSPHVLVHALEDPEDREWVTLTCSCEWSERVREEGAMAAFLGHADANIRSSSDPADGRFPAQQKCPGAAVTAPGVASPDKEDQR